MSSTGVGTRVHVAVSDLGTLGGLRQFATQFMFAAQPLACKLLIKIRRDVRVVEEHAWKLIPLPRADAH
jgi:hypothetical protein